MTRCQIRDYSGKDLTNPKCYKIRGHNNGQSCLVNLVDLLQDWKNYWETPTIVWPDERSKVKRDQTPLGERIDLLLYFGDIPHFPPPALEFSA